MREKWRSLRMSRRVAICLLPVMIAVLIWYVQIASRPGIWHWEKFLYEQSENVWQGTVYGEELTVIRAATADGGTLSLSSPIGDRNFRVEGQAEYEAPIVVYEDDREIFRGSWLTSGYLLDEKGDLAGDFMTITYGDSSGKTFIMDDGVEREVTALDMGPSRVTGLILEPETSTRGMPEMAVFSAMLFLAALSMLWWPEWGFRVGRNRFSWYASGNMDDLEPSDFYYSTQNVGIVVAIGAAVVIMIMGLTVR